jgi:hypothetical protein
MCAALQGEVISAFNHLRPFVDVNSAPPAFDPSSLGDVPLTLTSHFDVAKCVHIGIASFRVLTGVVTDLSLLLRRPKTKIMHPIH